MKRKITILVLILFVVLAGVLGWPRNSYRRELLDGTVLVLSGVKVGRTNIYYHGNWLSKTLGRFAPAKGITIAGIRFERPTTTTFTGIDGADVLSAQLFLLPGSPHEKDLLSPPFSRKYRLLYSANDDFDYTREFSDFRQQVDGVRADLVTWNFPRTAKQIRVRLEERTDKASWDWREVTTFTIKNPKPAAVQPWPADAVQTFKLPNGLDVEVGELVVRHDRIDIWDHTAQLPVRFTRAGQAITNWGIQYGPIRDASGNLDWFTYGFSRKKTNDWVIYQIHRVLNPALPWKFQVHFAADSDFLATNLHSTTLPWPITNAAHINLDGFQMIVQSPLRDAIDMTLTEKPSHLRLTFLSASDEKGTQLRELGGSWGQDGFHQSLQIPSPPPKWLQIKVVIHPDYEAEFTLQPRFERNPFARPNP